MVKLLILLIATVFAAAPPQLLERDRIGVNVEIGSPTQTFKLHPDTTASFSIVPGKTAEGRDESLPSFGQSKTVKRGNSVVVDNLYGKCSVTLAEDKASWGEFSIDNFHFGIVDKFYPSYQDNKAGKLALNLKNPISDKYLFASRLPNKTFTFAYEKTGFSLSFNSNKMDSASPGECQVPETNFENDKFKHNWLCNLSHFMLTDGGFENAITAGGFASFDSGSSFITAPMKFRDAFIESLDDACSLVDGPEFNYILCPSGTIVNSLTLVIQGRSYTIPSKELLLPFSEQHLVYGVLFSYKLEIGWNLGLLFFRTYDLTFDYTNATVSFNGPRIGDYTAEFNKYLKDTEEKAISTQQFYLITALVLVALFILLLAIYASYKSATAQPSRGTELI